MYSPLPTKAGWAPSGPGIPGSYRLTLTQEALKTVTNSFTKFLVQSCTEVKVQPAISQSSHSTAHCTAPAESVISEESAGMAPRSGSALRPVGPLTVPALVSGALGQISSPTPV